MYIKITSGVPENYTIGKLRRDNPNTSFSKTISDEILKNFGIYFCEQKPQPTINERNEKIEDGGFVQDENGNWSKTWNILQKTQEEINLWIDNLAIQVRNKRNMLLSETDYLALNDNTMSSEMASYRQSLRDITLQEGFPENVVWPVKPV